MSLNGDCIFNCKGKRRKGKFSFYPQQHEKGSRRKIRKVHFCVKVEKDPFSSLKEGFFFSPTEFSFSFHEKNGRRMKGEKKIKKIDLLFHP